jgi:hypothetical protein
MTPVLSYVLTTAAGPVVPDQTVQFTLTVTNLSSVAQPVYLYYDVPQFTTSEGESAGLPFPTMQAMWRRVLPKLSALTLRF